MKEKGYMHGIFAAVTRRSPKGVEKGETFNFSDHIYEFNMFRLDAKFSAGDVDYESENTGTLDDVRDYMFEVRGTGGIDFQISKSSRLTPYAGMGFRYLHDDLRGTSTTGASGYQRESRYVYLPFGLTMHTSFKSKWAFEITAEYDWFLDGRQRSHLEDADPGYNTLKNDQEEGFGLRGSIKLSRDFDKFNFYVEPFIRYWEIEDSKVAPVIFNGAVLGSGLEPTNNSTEYGVKVAASF